MSWINQHERPNAGLVDAVEDDAARGRALAAIYAQPAWTLDERTPKRMVMGIHAPGALNQAFFSPENIEYLQKKLVTEVKRLAGFDIDYQSTAELLAIMRGVYQMEGQPRPDMLKEDLEALNARVVAFAVPKIIVGVRSYRHYMEMQTRYPTPVDFPTWGSKAGTKGDGIDATFNPFGVHY